jgi:hypothetical protein
MFCAISTVSTVQQKAVFEFSMNLVMSMVRHHLMARALDGIRNLERLAVWKKDICWMA